MAIFAVALHRGETEEEARAMTFPALVIANVALIATNRAWSLTILAILRTPNPTMWWAVGRTLVYPVLVLQVPFLKVQFQLITLLPGDIGLCVDAGAVT